jgi:recombination protein RecA
MASVALTLSKLSKDLKTAQQLQAALGFQNSSRVLPLGIGALDEALPRHGLAFGTVVELQAHGASGAATSFALCACRAAQSAWSDAAWNDDIRDGNAMSNEVASSNDASSSDATNEIPRHRAPQSLQRRWCAFVDPTATLFAPGVAQLGVELDRLLVVRPKIDAVERVAVRIAEAKVVSVLVIDLRGVFGDLGVDVSRWQRTIRRLSLAVKPLSTCVLVLTSALPRQALPLPVSMRLEFNRLSRANFSLRVAKERTGRVSPPHTIAWSAFSTGAPPFAVVEAAQ